MSSSPHGLLSSTAAGGALLKLGCELGGAGNDDDVDVANLDLDGASKVLILLFKIIGAASGSAVLTPSRDLTSFMIQLLGH